jgi:glycosyltransferase involved in cell wall biosynthesis
LFIVMDNLNFGGQQLYYLNLAKYARRKGWNISTSFASKRSGNRSWEGEWKSLGPCHGLPCKGLFRSLSEIIPNIKSILVLLRYLKVERPDVILSGSSWSRGIASVVGIITKIPVVNLPGSRWFTGKLYYFLAKLSGPLHSCEGYISSAPANKAEYLKLGVETRRLISTHHGVDLEEFKPNEDLRENIRRNLSHVDENLVLGFAGRLDAEFGLVTAIELIKETKNWHLLIVGDGPERENIQRKVDELNLENRVILTGFVDSPARYISAMDCALVYISYHYGDHYNLGTFCLEALATGIPVLHFVKPEICDGYDEGKSGFYVDSAENPNLLLNRLKFFEENTDQLTSMGEEARKLAVQNFNRDEGLGIILDAFKLLSTGSWPDGSLRSLKS